VSAHFDLLLIELEFITGDVGPDCSLMTGTCAELLDRLEDAVDCFVDCGVDGLSIELLLADAIAGRSMPGMVSSCRVWAAGRATRTGGGGGYPSVPEAFGRNDSSNGYIAPG
jgi:hypothetical protein